MFLAQLEEVSEQASALEQQLAQAQAEVQEQAAALESERQVRTELAAQAAEKTSQLNQLEGGASMQ